MSKTAFVEDAVRAVARKVVARADVTLMDAEVFDTMMSALGRADESAELAEFGALPRLICRPDCSRHRRRATPPAPTIGWLVGTPPPGTTCPSAGSGSAPGSTVSGIVAALLEAAPGQ